MKERNPNPNSRPNPNPNPDPSPNPHPSPHPSPHPNPNPNQERFGLRASHVDASLRERDFNHATATYLLVEGLDAEPECEA